MYTIIKETLLKMIIIEKRLQQTTYLMYIVRIITLKKDDTAPEYYKMLELICKNYKHFYKTYLPQSKPSEVAWTLQSCYMCISYRA